MFSPRKKSVLLMDVLPDCNVRDESWFGGNDDSCLDMNDDE